MLINGIWARVFLPLPGHFNNYSISVKPDTLKPTTDTLRKQVDTLRPAIDPNAFDSEVHYEAEDSIRMELENKKAYLYGNAMVHYNDFDLKAAYIEIDNKNSLITAVGVPDSTGKIQGSPQFKQGKDEMKCEKVIYNIKTKKGKIFGILTKQNEFFIFGEAVKKDTNNVMYIKKMKCIPCEFEDANIYFRASRAKIIPNDKIVTGSVFLEISNIPTPLGLPFGFFPNVKKEKSKTGILMPSYGYSATQGFYLMNMGYFLPISNKMQLNLYGNLYSNGSWSLGGNGAGPLIRYKVNYKYSGTFDLAYSRNVTGIPEDNPVFGSKRDGNALTKVNNFKIIWTHSQDNRYDPTIRFSSSVNIGSAGFGRYNNQSQTNYLTSTLLSNISFTKMFRSSTLTINMSDNQNLITHLLHVDAPQLTYMVNRMFPFKNQAHTSQNWLDKLYIDYSLQSKASLNINDTVLKKIGLSGALSAAQYGLMQSIPIGTNISLFNYFTLNPQATFQQYTAFQTSEEKYDTSTKTINAFPRNTPKLAFDQNYQINLTTKVYGDFLFRSKLIKQIRHQLIPTIGFVFHPDMQKGNLNFYKVVPNAPTLTRYSIFENNIFGGPAGPESGAITFNLNNTVDAKVRKTTDTSVSYKKVNIIQMLSIGGSYDLAAQKNKLSLINLTARSSFFKNIVNVSFASVFDPYALNYKGQRSDTLSIKEGGSIARFTSCNFSMNGTLSNTKIKSLQNSKQPFSISLNYTLQFVKGVNIPATHIQNSDNITLIPGVNTPNSYTQNLMATFSVKPTTKWKFDVTTGYDFKVNNISYTRFTIYRDLRCWEARITWVPLGQSKQYMLTINLKTASLRDIKIPKQKLWQDNL